MRHVIEIFDASSDTLLQSAEIPQSYAAQLAELMSWTEPEDPYDGYDLSPAQIETLEVWTDTVLKGDHRIIQLVCLE